MGGALLKQLFLFYMEQGKQVVQEEQKEQKKQKEQEEKEEQEDEVPAWLWEGEDPASYFMPVNTLKLTDPLTVVRV